MRDGAGSSLLEAEAVSRVDALTGAKLLENISLRVIPGEWLALAGPSGAGKTVLLRALALLDPIQRGQVTWRGNAVAPSEIPAYRARVVYLHQRATLFEGSVEANLRLPFELSSHRRQAFSREVADRYFDALGRERSFLARSSRDLSGGETQMVALVRALSLAPQVLLLDEATSALDSTTAVAARELLRNWLTSESDRAVVWVSHDASAGEQYATRAIRLRQGRLVERSDDAI